LFERARVRHLSIRKKPSQLRSNAASFIKPTRSAIDTIARLRTQPFEGLHFHDLRHEAALRFAPTMQVQDLSKLMG
jgi:hypothetical protein